MTIVNIFHPNFNQINPVSLTNFFLYFGTDGVGHFIDYVNEYFYFTVNYFTSFFDIYSKNNCNQRQKNNHLCVARVTKLVRASPIKLSKRVS
jgi:hypothetical protein